MFVELEVREADYSALCWRLNRADLLRYQANLLVPQANDEAKDSIEMNGRSLRSSNSKSKGKGKAVVPPATENPNKKGSNKGKAKVAQKEENSDDSDIEIIESVNQDPNDRSFLTRSFSHLTLTIFTDIIVMRIQRI